MSDIDEDEDDSEVDEQASTDVDELATASEKDEQADDEQASDVDELASEGEEDAAPDACYDFNRGANAEPAQEPAPKKQKRAEREFSEDAWQAVRGWHRREGIRGPFRQLLLGEKAPES